MTPVQKDDLPPVGKRVLALCYIYEEDVASQKTPKWCIAYRFREDSETMLIEYDLGTYHISSVLAWQELPEIPSELIQ